MNQLAVKRVIVPPKAVLVEGLAVVGGNDYNRILVAPSLPQFLEQTLDLDINVLDTFIVGI
jgi:hypothetical protein